MASFLQQAKIESTRQLMEQKKNEMINLYENSCNTMRSMMFFSGIVFVLCLFWHLSADKYTKVLFVEALSMSWFFSLILIIVTGFLFVFCLFYIFRYKSKIKEIQEESIEDFASKLDEYIFDNKGILGLLNKK